MHTVINSKPILDWLRMNAGVAFNINFSGEWKVQKHFQYPREAALVSNTIGYH